MALFYLYYLKNIDNVSLKSIVIFNLGGLEEGFVDKALLEVLSDPNEDSSIRMDAIMALKNLGKDELAEPFIKAISSKLRKKIKSIKKIVDKIEKIEITKNIFYERHDSILFIFFNNIIVTKEIEKFLEFIESKEKEVFFDYFETVNLNFCNCKQLGLESNKIFEKINSLDSHSCFYFSNENRELFEKLDQTKFNIIYY